MSLTTTAVTLSAAGDDIEQEEDQHFMKVIQSLLPAHYDFEIQKTIGRLRKLKARRVALQMPEGLLLFATSLVTLFEQFTYPPETENALECVVMGDVTYGACCVDDFTANALGCDVLVHYGHSCLVPIQETSLVHCLYVFVSIQFDLQHALASIRRAFPLRSQSTKDFENPCSPSVQPSSTEVEPLHLVATIQFASSLGPLHDKLQLEGYTPLTAQSKPLSAGELLGCTSPRLPEYKGQGQVVYIGDGRFHLEAMMLANPDWTRADRFFRYDPYTRELTREQYAHSRTMRQRCNAIMEARRIFFSSRPSSSSSLSSPPVTIGLVWGTLGRQGNPAVVQTLKRRAEAVGIEVVVIMMSELNPSRLKAMALPVWIQTSCPRLSIDWGHEVGGGVPVLSPYEAVLALLPSVLFHKQCPGWMLNVLRDEKVEGEFNEVEVQVELEGRVEDSKREELLLPKHQDYPMDFYAFQSLGPWTPNHRPTTRTTKIPHQTGAGWKERLAAKRLARQQQRDVGHVVEIDK